MKPLTEIETYLLDMDGTIYLSDYVYPCTLPFLSLLKAQGKRYIFLTNNSSTNKTAYLERLDRLGIPVDGDSVFTSGEATTIYLSAQKPGARVFLCGTPDLEEEFRQAGFTLTDRDPDYAVLGFDKTLTYEKLVKLCDFVRAGLPFIATHPDFNCPVTGGFIPDTGSMLALVKASTGRDPDYIVGKPNRGIVDALARKYGLPLDTMAMVGDRLYTDIAVGVNAGITSILVLSGESTLDDLAVSDVKPDYVFSDLSGITQIIKDA